VRILNHAAPRLPARYLLHWIQATRRVESNPALEFAIRLANQLDLPVLCYEELDCAWPHASDRWFTFALEGVPETQRRLRKLGLGYVFRLRRKRADPGDCLNRLAREAAAVVTDDYPTGITARNTAEVPARLAIPCYAVDASCIVPMSLFPKREYAAYTLRPKLKKLLPRFLRSFELPQPARRWRGAPPELHTEVKQNGISALVASCQIDHRVPPSVDFRGGRSAAEARLDHFLHHNLSRYARYAREPSARATSELSPYLVFGYIGALEVALRVGEYASEHKLIAEEFLEELIVRRELAFNFACHAQPPDSLEHLPDWAQATLDRHARDRRDPVYTSADFAHARTHDALWNATQKELLRRGKIHGYYRMYWGKKIIEWSPTPGQALRTMVALHDRYALDGRDPNTYANILWCFGLHDRPWAERPILGTVRCMSLAGMRRKTGVDAYIHEMENP
jgi:deoxyribodipyrimidine photo-lyase